MAFSNRLVSPAAPRTDPAAAAPAGSPDARLAPHLTGLPGGRDEEWGDAFRDAALGMCAVLSATDGRIDPAARMRVAQMTGEHEVLGRRPAEDLRNRFEDNCARLIMDPAFGHAYVMAQIAKATEYPDQAAAVLRIGLTVGRTDGELGAHAATVIREACQVLRMDPREFGL
ncbi:TerB family tellurite resistance protein [Nocardia sp. NPDC005746]|uniref:tellurite resistance TerB family protein n=1 Tax=Nocardia sp. NPDC005746 TaxID=3157062 RepID=UPI003404C4A6